MPLARLEALVQVAQPLPSPRWLNLFANYDVTAVRLVSCAGKLRGADATVTATIAVDWLDMDDDATVTTTSTLTARWQGTHYECDGTWDVPASVLRQADEWLAREAV